MPTIPIATIIPGPKYTLTPKGASDASGLFMLGNSDRNNTQVGAFSIHFVMSNDWNGTIGILGRSGVYEAGVDDIPLLGPWPFRAFYLNNAGWDGTMLSANGTTPPLITGTSSILVPAYGQTIGLGVACNAGKCVMYYLPLLGPSVV